MWAWGSRARPPSRSTSPVLNPLDDFQPRSRQILAGAALGWSGPLSDVRLDYQREVDRDTRNFVSEQAALSLDFRPLPRWSLAAGVDYDLANTWFGNADAVVRYTAPWITVAGGLRQYRPHFDLWTIWGAFSPGALSRGERGACGCGPSASSSCEGDGSTTPTPIPKPRHRWSTWTTMGGGWASGLTYRPTPAWTLDAGYHEEYGPGASSHGFEGAVTFLPIPTLSLTAYGSTLDRPLEFRFEEASVDALGLDAEWSPTDRLRIAIGAARYWEDRDRPDAAAFDWDQTRLHARVTLLFRSETDAVPLPPALRTRPRAGSR